VLNPVLFASKLINLIDLSEVCLTISDLIKENRLRKVPANCSRYLKTKQDAENTRIATVDLAIDSTKMYVINTEFDASLIIQDLQYCTTNRFQLEKSTANFRKIIQNRQFNQIVDIGCGQGEFVDYLMSENIRAIGFDPVLRNENLYCKKMLFKPSENKIGSKNIYVMRCVLPHLINPFVFLEEIFISDSKAMVYIEYQNLEWIIGEQVWQQISHDHVNYFSINTFDSHFNVLDKGLFGNGEWSFILIDGRKSNTQLMCLSNLGKLIELEENVSALLEKQIERTNAPIGIYGAAGKGTLFAYELKKLGIEGTVAYDEEPLFWSNFLEASGTQVRNPIEIGALNLSPGLIVMNPNHYDYAVKKYGALVGVYK